MTSRQIFVRALVALASACAVGCASDKDALEKRVVTMQEELVAVQNANDRLAERLMAIEIQQSKAGSARAQNVHREPDAEAVERPPLKVVRVSPSGASAPERETEPAESGENAEDDAPRPVIRDLGSGRQARPGAGRGIVRQNKGRTEPPAGAL